MTDYMIKIAQDRGIKKIFAYFLKDNEAIQKIFEKKGFKIIQEQKVWRAEKNVDSEKKQAVGRGVGPVDAVKKAITSVIGHSITLKNYNLKAITGGTNALADVEITVEDKNGKEFKVQAVNEDITIASALALIEGINKALNFQRKIKN